MINNINNNNNNDRSCLLIDASIPADKHKHTSVKVVEKLSKYKDLEIEIERLWEMKTTTVLLVTGALGIIKEGTQRFINKIPRHIRQQELQKTTLLGAAHILQRVLSMQ